AAARDGADRSPEALNAICRSYWYPLYAYARGRGIPAPDAEDMTQEFFRLLLEKHWLDKADPRRGRLRTFLIVAMKKFMANEWRRAAAQKRGGGNDLVPLDIAVAESRYAAEPPSGADGDEVFDRQWALN